MMWFSLPPRRVSDQSHFRQVMSGTETIRILSSKSIGPEEFQNIKRSLSKVNAENQEPTGFYTEELLVGVLSAIDVVTYAMPISFQTR